MQNRSAVRADRLWLIGEEFASDKGAVRIRPIFIVALCFAVAGGALAFVVGGGTSRYERLQAAMAAQRKALDEQLATGRPHLPETIAAIDSLRLRSGFRRFTTQCEPGYVRCYVVTHPPNIVAPEIPRLLRSIGGESDRMLPAYRDAGLKYRCMTSPVHAWSVICTGLVLLDHNEIGVVLGPHFLCADSLTRCRFSGESQILFTIPATGSPTSP